VKEKGAQPVKGQYQMNKKIPTMEEILKNEEKEDDETESVDDDSVSEVYSLHSEDFLKDMENDVFGIEEKQEEQPNMVKELKELRQKTALAREQAKLRAFQEKEVKQFTQQQKGTVGPKPSSNEVMDEETEILGKDRRIVMAKISMYREMFKTELKHTKFRIKKGATTQDLELILEEMETIVSINGMEAFTMDVIMGSLKLVEGVSSMTQQFDITGLADALKENPEFSKLVKLLFIKYQSFAQTPPEYRLIFIVLVNAVICTRMNKSKKVAVQTKNDAPI
jgi:hypothetical protein